MPNPNNNISLRGEMCGTPRISELHSEEIAARFELRVKRNYRGKDGEYRDDVLPIRYVCGENRRDFLRSLAPGDKVSLCGCLCRERHDGAWRCFVSADSITVEERVTDPEERVTADFNVDLELPY